MTPTPPKLIVGGSSSIIKDDSLFSTPQQVTFSPFSSSPLTKKTSIKSTQPNYTETARTSSAPLTQGPSA
ncbi:hypothetical protein BDV38DRAFT_236728 [Aspergillus pseudotamarii]|uniref:Uncharacterized protein n=1 Tax=Aspergillus pseudotamarii TaxID=132259 RepID=A0A5N6T6K4_ASPPS|nr:uncharacterized protein BDV38DRAFT_236728 [Aspergillus pseudotamarii]KAE8141968.1 hypothetical protein BDV38DRAFT_236728 [Aspergillus pseudotamarii]